MSIIVILSFGRCALLAASNSFIFMFRIGREKVIDRNLRYLYNISLAHRGIW